MTHRFALLALATLGVAACADAPTLPLSDLEANAGSWRTWVLASGAEVRPAAPSANVAAETDEILALQRTRTAATDSMIRRWSGSPTLPWDSAGLRMLDFYFPLLPDVRLATPVRAARVSALLHVAAYDALVAVWNAKAYYNRAAPSLADSRVAPLIDAQGVPSYPSEHAAVGAAEAAVLTYLFPTEDTLAWQRMARDAGEARIVGGAAYRSDVDAGAAIGRAVASRVIARARADGSDAAWTGTRPTSSNSWQPTPNKFVQVPFDAGAGVWRTWVLASGNALRPPPPPATGSAEFTADLNELRALSTGRTTEQTNIARYWATDAPSVIWEKDMLREVTQRGLAPVAAARAQALASVAMYDAFVACWDAKFAYWLMRPVTADQALRTVFPTPPFPSYPSGHSTISSAAGEVFAELFPDAAQYYRDRATEASLSRVYAAVHYRFDVDAGDTLGVRIGRLVVARARDDGAPR